MTVDRWLQKARSPKVKDELGLLRLEPKWRPGTFAQEPRKNMVKTTARVRPTL